MQILRSVDFDHSFAAFGIFPPIIRTGPLEHRHVAFCAFVVLSYARTEFIVTIIHRWI
jgi:hypothetical protein